MDDAVCFLSQPVHVALEVGGTVPTHPASLAGVSRCWQGGKVLEIQQWGFT